MLIDLHQDLVAHFYNTVGAPTITIDSFREISPSRLEEHQLQVSLRSLRALDVRLIVAASFPLSLVKQRWTNYQGKKNVARQLETYQALEKSGDDFRIIRSRTQFEHSADNRGAPIGLILALEGADGLNNATEVLHYLKRGVKLFGLTWNLKNKFAGGLWTSQGLTREGEKFVTTVDNNGGAIDLVHLHPLGVKKVLSLSPRKILVSHTALSAFSRHSQNLTFATIEEIIKKDGIIGFGFLRTFFSKIKSGWQKVATIEKLAMELTVFKKRFGSDHIAIGSDYGGYPYDQGVIGAQNILGLLDLKGRLKNEGWTSEEIHKLYYQNARVFLSELF